MPIVGQFGGIGAAGFFVPGGAFESIATVTVGSGGASEIAFTDIPGSFQHLQVRLIARSVWAGELQSAFGIRLGNGSIDSGSNYAYHLLYGDGASALAAAGTSQSQGSGGVTSASTATTSAYAAGIIDILDYASTSKNKTVRSFNGLDRNGGGQVRLTSSLWMSTSAVTHLTITESNAKTFLQYTTAALYGVRA